MPSPNTLPSPVLPEHPAPSAPKFELRLYGLNPSVTSDHLINFFASHTQVLGALIHLQSYAAPSKLQTLQWAQVWVTSEEAVNQCLELKMCLAPSGITLARAPTSSVPRPTHQGNSTPESITPNASFELKTPPTPTTNTQFSVLTAPHPSSILPGLCIPATSSGSVGGMSAFGGTLSHGANFANLGFKHVDTRGPLPRNLYVMGLPLDLTQIQFKALFTTFGMVEHSTLLSQLDGMGRRRGFVLMSTHHEATEAMRAMNGTWYGGFKLDVSWALVQREAKHFGSNGIMPNRVVHPPTVPTRREPLEECTVIVEDLDPGYFPDPTTIREVFSHFGPVGSVNILSTVPLQVLIQFDHAVSATALVAANGLNLGGRPLVAKRHARAINPMPTFNSALTSTPIASRMPFDPFSGNDVNLHASRITGKPQPGPVFTSESLQPHLHQAQRLLRSQPSQTLTPIGPFKPLAPPTPASYNSFDEKNLDRFNSILDLNTAPFSPLAWKPSQVFKKANALPQENDETSQQPGASGQSHPGASEENKCPMNASEKHGTADSMDTREKNGDQTQAVAGNPLDRWQLPPTWCMCFLSASLKSTDIS